MNDFGGYRAHVSVLPAWDSTGVWLVRRRVLDGVRELSVAAPVDLEWLPHGEAEAFPYRPSLTLPNELARSVADEVALHFGGVSPSRALREDFLHERARVDKLTDAVLAALAREGSER